MGQAAAPLSLAATGLSAGSKIMAGDTQSSNLRTQGVNDILSAGTLRIQGQNDLEQGREAQDFHNFKATGLDTDATYGQVKAAQTDTFFRDSLMSTLSNISAVRASANTASDSPTGAAISNRVEAQGDAARQQRVANINAQIASDRAGAALERAAGLSALSQGQINQKLKESGAEMEEANAASAEAGAKSARFQGQLSGFGTILSGIAGLVKGG